MFTLIAIGVGVAYLYSTIVMLFPNVFTVSPLGPEPLGPELVAEGLVAEGRKPKGMRIAESETVRILNSKSVPSPKSGVSSFE